MSDSLYKDVLMDHYHHPRNRGEVTHCDVIRRGRNPRCGDDLEIGVNFSGDTLKQVIFHGRGCSVCMASASMMTETVTNLQRAEVKQLYQLMKNWFSSTKQGDTKIAPIEALSALNAVHQYAARHRCVMLSWQALYDALD